MPRVSYRYIKSAAYKETWDLQQALLDQAVAIKMQNRKEGIVLPIENHLIFCDHPHVYTLGKSGEENHLLLNNQSLKEKGVEFFKINRGGDITYHGPGQLVGYPILDLEQFFTDIHKYLRFLEQAVIDTLAEFGIQAGRYDGFTGVWIDADNPSKARKICAMGVRCSRWVTMHGFALNINTDLNYFNHIVPCGILDKGVTSMQQELKKHVDEALVQQILLEKLAAHFDMQIIQI